MTRRFSPEVEAAIEAAARRNGMDPGMLRAFVAIESGGNPRTTTGSYKGLLQLSNSEFARHGGGGDIYDINANLDAGARKLQAERAEFARRFGREPTAAEIYLQHQQGVGGAAAHMSNPNAPAWQNMASTGEGRAKGESWAKRAIWGNVPTDMRGKFGSVDNITSQQFMDMWANKVARFGGGSVPQMTPTGPVPEPGNPMTGMEQRPQMLAADPEGAADLMSKGVLPTGAPTPTSSPAPTMTAAAPDFNTSNLGASLGAFGEQIGKLLQANAPKPPQAPLVQARRPQVDLGQIMALLKQRQMRGNGSTGGGSFGLT